MFKCEASGAVSEWSGAAIGDGADKMTRFLAAFEDESSESSYSQAQLQQFLQLHDRGSGVNFSSRDENEPTLVDGQLMCKAARALLSTLGDEDMSDVSKNTRNIQVLQLGYQRPSTLMMKLYSPTHVRRRYFQCASRPVHVGEKTFDC